MVAKAGGSIVFSSGGSLIVDLDLNHAPSRA